MPPEDKSRIEELKRSLYSRSSPDVRTRRKLRFGDKESSVQTAWERPREEPDQPVLNETYKDKSMSFLSKLLIASAIFCVIAVGVGAYLFLNGANLISADNIDISISGPVSIPGGEPVSFDIGVINKNNVDLKLVDMAVEFPVGTTDPTDQTKELKQYRKLLGDIATGGTAHDTVSAVVFGEENMQKQITVTLTCSIKGSTSVFTKSKSYAVLINSSPINVTVSSYKEITSGQEFDIKVKIKSNSQQILRNNVLKANYPFGFTFISSDLKPGTDNATWKLGDLPAGGDRTVTIHGKLQGEDTDARTFHFTVGAQGSGSTVAIGTEYMSVQQDITIQKPFITLAMTINGDTSSNDFVGQVGAEHVVELTWFNNLTVPVTNAQITVHLSGTAYDKNSVFAETGNFKSDTGDIVWNQQTDPNLVSIAAGDSGHEVFTITPRDNSMQSNLIVNPLVTLSANVSGNRPQESNVSGQVTVASTRNIKISSNPSLSGQVVRSIGAFVNTGPIPPQAEKDTTFTIVWTVDNTSNAISNTQVTASLPAYVTWMNNISPASENLNYDKNSGIITWNIGNMGTYTTSSSRRKEVSFQVSIKPNVNQIDQVPTLVNQAVLTATDNFTNQQLQSTQEILNTRFSTDPIYQEGQGVVVK